MGNENGREGTTARRRQRKEEIDGRLGGIETETGSETDTDRDIQTDRDRQKGRYRDKDSQRERKRASAR